MRLALGLLLAIHVCAPSTAQAQQTDPDVFWGATIGVAVPMLAVDAVFVALAIDAWANEQLGLQEPAAILEAVWGAVHVAGAAVAIGVSTLAYDPVPLALTFGIPLTLVGAYFLTHGLLSLFGEPTPLGPRARLSVVTNGDGVAAIIQGSF